eukprot:3539214-Amphidinium_carterae.1
MDLKSSVWPSIHSTMDQCLPHVCAPRWVAEALSVGKAKTVTQAKAQAKYGPIRAGSSHHSGLRKDPAVDKVAVDPL